MKNTIIVFVLFASTLLAAQDRIERFSDSRIQLTMSEESSRIFLEKIGDMADSNGILNYATVNSGFLFECSSDSCIVTIDLKSIDFRTAYSNVDNTRAYLDLNSGRDLYRNLFKNFQESGVSGTSMMKEKVLFDLTDGEKTAKLACIRSTYVLERFDCGLIIE